MSNLLCQTPFLSFASWNYDPETVLITSWCAATTKRDSWPNRWLRKPEAHFPTSCDWRADLSIPCVKEQQRLTINSSWQDFHPCYVRYVIAFVLFWTSPSPNFIPHNWLSELFPSVSRIFQHKETLFPSFSEIGLRTFTLLTYSTSPEILFSKPMTRKAQSQSASSEST